MEIDNRFADFFSRPPLNESCWCLDDYVWWAFWLASLHSHLLYDDFSQTSNYWTKRLFNATDVNKFNYESFHLKIHSNLIKKLSTPTQSTALLPFLPRRVKYFRISIINISKCWRYCDSEPRNWLIVSRGFQFSLRLGCNRLHKIFTEVLQISSNFVARLNFPFFNSFLILSPRQKVPLKVTKIWKTRSPQLSLISRSFDRWQKHPKRQTRHRYWCVCTVEGARHEKSPFLCSSHSAFDILAEEKRQRAELCHTWKTLRQQQCEKEKKRRGKSAAWKNRESENTQFFFICLPLRYKFRIREETGIFPNCWVLALFSAATRGFFPSRLRHKTIFFRSLPVPFSQCEKIFC